MKKAASKIFFFILTLSTSFILFSLFWPSSVVKHGRLTQHIAQESSGQVGPIRPNIVFVLIDDYGFHDIGYHGSKILTPTLDELAASGVKLENYYVQPMCSPTRAQLMSGRHPIHLGHQHNVLMHCQPSGLTLDVPTVADKLKEAGYATHMVGKWHLGFYQAKLLPYNRGFDTFYGTVGGLGDHFNHTMEYKGKRFLDLHDNHGPIKTETGHYSTHLFTEKAIDVVKSHNKTKPLFLYLSYQAVHNPLQVPEKYIKLYSDFKSSDRKNYAGMVSAMDEGVANLTKTLKERGLWDNTVLILSSDNGGRLSEGASNYPLRGEKFYLLEGGVRAVGFVTGGKHIGLPKGRISEDLIDISDWYPTFVRLARGHMNDTMTLDGFDQWDTVRNGAPSQRKVILHNIDPLHKKKGVRLFNDTFDTRIYAAIRVGDYKLLTGDQPSSKVVPPPEENIYVTPSKEPTESTEKNVWLFNIREDPSEGTDLSEKRPDMVRKMLNLLQEYSENAKPPYYPKDDPKCDPATRNGIWEPWM